MGAKHVIREVAVVPEVPPDLVVYERSEIERFVAAARRTVARLQAEVDELRAAQHSGEPELIDLTDTGQPEVGPYKRTLFSLPHWTERPTGDTDIEWFESLREA